MRPGLLHARTVVSETIAWLASLHPRPSRKDRIAQLRSALVAIDNARQPGLPFRKFVSESDDEET